ncbi:MAG TPA: LPXTG cell wall anchor domain-containing protein [Roseiflexaceae bacterium]|nr:LPXTG cell wall anchor domain-containing protein [Roseiflexaceae bacterium]
MNTRRIIGMFVLSAMTALALLGVRFTVAPVAVVAAQERPTLTPSPLQPTTSTPTDTPTPRPPQEDDDDDDDPTATATLTATAELPTAEPAATAEPPTSEPPTAVPSLAPAQLPRTGAAQNNRVLLAVIAGLAALLVGFWLARRKQLL